MCGIHGLVDKRGSYAGQASSLLSSMGNVTVHRGPDSEGQFHDGPAIIGMRRLSIIDVEGGRQPLFNEARDVVAVCNGEIYNFRQLRARLESAGHRFRTASDCEVLVHLYEEHGDDFVRHLDGMFGFALWDLTRKRLLVGRDRLGIKPLYWLENGQMLAFASEAKALLELPGVPRELDTEALPGYLALGYVAQPRSMLKGIAKLPPATLLVHEGGRTRLQPYWALSALSASGGTGVDRAEAVHRVRSGLEAAVASQMVADVPVGAFLSGGVDSSAVVALMARQSSGPVRTFSIGFKGSSGAAVYNELPFARQVAQLFGTDHHEIIVQPDAAALLPRLLWHMDEPVADSAFITSYLVSEFARRHVTVVLSGVGGDELFGGYRRYLGGAYAARYQSLPKWLRRGVIDPLASALPADRHSKWLNRARLLRAFVREAGLPFAERYRNWVGVFDDRLVRDCLKGEVDAGLSGALDLFRAGEGLDELTRMMWLDCSTQLPDDLLLLTDKMSMATSLECRVPLLDTALVEMAFQLPAGLKVRGTQLKAILKDALEGTLPHDILHREKRGFGAPFGAWLREELAPVISTVLSRAAVERRGLLHWPVLESIIEAHRTLRADHTDHLLALLNLELWSRVVLDREDPDAVAAAMHRSGG